MVWGISWQKNKLEIKDYIFLAHATTNNRATMKLEDLDTESVIQIGQTKFVYIGNNRYAQIKPTCHSRVWDFTYTGSAQTFTVPMNGTYKIELWGAQGAKADSGEDGGRGGYTSGQISLTKGMNLFVYVGNQGTTKINAWNGGGVCHQHNSSYCGSSGGGATDVRLTEGVWDNAASLKSRIMVAGGGGGAGAREYFTTPGAGGGLNGYDSAGVNSWQPSLGATQVAGGYNLYTTSSYIDDTYGSFGMAPQVDNNTCCGAGGGSGWYGGGGGCGSSAGGGSSYISGHTGCVAITSLADSTPKSGCTTGTTNKSCSLSPTGYSFTDTVMIDGLGYSWTNTKGSLQAMPNPAGGAYAHGTGHTGNGYARITYLPSDCNGLVCGAHSHTNPDKPFQCDCDAGYFASTTGSTFYTTTGGSCSYQKYCSGSNVTGPVYTTSAPSSCTCKSGYYGNTEGTTFTTTATGNCVPCATDTAYNSTVKRCIATTMQAFTPAMCADFPNPSSSTGYTSVGSLKDTRDNRFYTVRKYADGRCWLAENLKFGSNCTATKYDVTSSQTGYVGTYNGYAYLGLCRLHKDSAYDGYLYNWEAVMNNSTAVYNGTYDNRVNGTTLAAHDICPLGWHVPSGGINGEWLSLVNSFGDGSAPSFLRTTGANAWNSTNLSTMAGETHGQNLWTSQVGTAAGWWSSTNKTQSEVYGVWAASDTYAGATNTHLKNLGIPVRCISDVECGSHAQYNADTQTCTCDKDWFVDENGTTSFISAGTYFSCNYRKCGTGTTGGYSATTCSCVSGKYADALGKRSVDSAIGTCNYNKYCTGLGTKITYATTAPSSCSCLPRHYTGSNCTGTSTTVNGTCGYFKYIPANNGTDKCTARTNCDSTSGGFCWGEIYSDVTYANRNKCASGYSLPTYDNIKLAAQNLNCKPYGSTTLSYNFDCDFEDEDLNFMGGTFSVDWDGIPGKSEYWLSGTSPYSSGNTCNTPVATIIWYGRIYITCYGENSSLAVRCIKNQSLGVNMS